MKMKAELFDTFYLSHELVVGGIKHNSNICSTNATHQYKYHVLITINPLQYMYNNNVKQFSRLNTPKLAIQMKTIGLISNEIFNGEMPWTTVANGY